VTANKTEVLKDVVVAGRGSYEPGDDVRVSIRVVDGTVLAKAWAADANEPDWQLRAAGGASASTGDGIRILGYLSKVAPNAVNAPWSELSAQLR
jgi:hypothetical protein